MSAYTKLRDAWRPAVATAGLAAYGGIAAIAGEPLFAVLSFSVAAAGGIYTGLELLSDPKSEQDEAAPVEIQGPRLPIQ